MKHSVSFSKVKCINAMNHLFTLINGNLIRKKNTIKLSIIKKNKERKTVSTVTRKLYHIKYKKNIQNLTKKRKMPTQQLSKETHTHTHHKTTCKISLIFSYLRSVHPKTSHFLPRLNTGLWNLCYL